MKKYNRKYNKNTMKYNKNTIKHNKYVFFRKRLKKFQFFFKKIRIFLFFCDRSIDDDVMNTVTMTTTPKRRKQWCENTSKRAEIENRSKMFRKLMTLRDSFRVLQFARFSFFRFLARFWRLRRSRNSCLTEMAAFEAIHPTKIELKIEKMIRNTNSGYFGTHYTYEAGYLRYPVKGGGLDHKITPFRSEWSQTLKNVRNR